MSERGTELETDGDAEVAASGIFRVPIPLHRELLRLAESEEAELSVTLLAAFQALLLRTAGQDRIVVEAILPAPVPQGDSPGVSATIRTADLPDDPAFRDFVHGARDQWRRCRVVTGSSGDPADETGGRSAAAPLPSGGAAFTMGSVADRLTLRDVEQRLLRDTGICLIPTLRLLQTGDDLFGLFVPSGSGLLSESDPSRIGSRYLRLLRGVTQDVHRPIRSIPLLSDGEREQVLFKWNDNASAYPTDACIHQLVEAQAARSPDAPAIASSRHVLTYRDLNERSNRIAAYLVDRGAGAETIVAAYLDRSAESLAGVLGILKSGAAYAPLDPEHPADLTDMILEDLGRPMLMTHGRFAERFAAHPRPIVRLDGDWGQIASGSAEKATASPVRPDDLACVIHTSGSTGRPKGVLVTHRNLVASTTARPAFYSEPVQRFLLLSSFAYDSSLAGIFWTLSEGGLLVVPDDETRRDPLALGRLIREREVTHLLGVPSLYASVLAESRAEDLASLRTAIVAGESCPKALLAAHASKAPGASLFNEYGPTETTVWSTVYACPPEAVGSSVPIGRPIANTQIYLLDENREPVPVGAPGEIFIGGDGVTRGYWRQPALTAERFVSNPFGVGTSRVYRTGDLARHLPDGNLEFLGRVDHQVKIRGVRVEPAQIEAVLEKHAQVRQAVVVAREDPSGRKRLIAYAVPKHPARPAAEELRRHLRERLPAPLVPETVVLLDTLPLTPGGKLDRRALPDAGHARPALSEPFVAARNASEEILAAIWEELLALPEVGVRDDFFELGGDSLLATRVVSRIRDAFALELPLRRLFEAPTVSALAREIEKSRALSASLPAPPRVTPRPRGDELPLSFAQQRLWFLDQLEPGNPTYNIPAAFRLTGTLDAGVLQRSLQKIVARHEALRTTFPAVDGRPLQVVTDPETFPLTLHDFSGFPEPERSEIVARTIREEVQRPFDLAGRPLLRARVLRLSERDSILLLTIHHIAADDWSLDVVFGELSAAYAALLAGEDRSSPSSPFNTRISRSARRSGCRENRLAAC